MFNLFKRRNYLRTDVTAGILLKRSATEEQIKVAVDNCMRMTNKTGMYYYVRMLSEEEERKLEEKKKEDLD